MVPTVVFVATYDTKGVESDYIKKRVEANGARCLTIDVGVGGKPNPEFDLADWVLSGFTASEEKALSFSLEAAGKAALAIVDGSVGEAANRYNGAHPE